MFRAMVKTTVILASLLPACIFAQDDVQVDCTPDHMEIRVTKGIYFINIYVLKYRIFIQGIRAPPPQNTTNRK